MPKNVKKSTAKAAPGAEAPPTYLIETPPDNSYQLAMFDDIEGTDVEQIELSRAEYLAIKKVLIKMRGYKVPEVTNA